MNNTSTQTRPRGGKVLHLFHQGALIAPSTPHAGTIIYLPTQSLLAFCADADDAHLLMRQAQLPALRQSAQFACSKGGGEYSYVLSLNPCVKGQVWTCHAAVDVVKWAEAEGIDLYAETGTKPQ